MTDLITMAQSFLRADGWDVRASDGGQLTCTRPGLAGTTDIQYVWIPTIADPEQFRYQSGPLVQRFVEAASRHPAAPKFLLMATLEGVTAEFRTQAKRHRVLVRVPVQFFDNDFKWEISREAASASSQLRERGRSLSLRRIKQPFSGAAEGDDLLEHLTRQLTESAPSFASIHFVVGPAGVGKSVLFASLFSELLNEFLNEKAGFRPGKRPLPLLPDHISPGDSGSVRAILRGFLESEFARNIDRGLFDWAMANGWAAWLIDGLDEVIAHDPDFFDSLADLLTYPGGTGRPHVVVCLRDSLLSTSNEFANFVDDYRDHVAIYRLERWSRSTKRQYAMSRLGAKGDRYLDLIRARKSLDDLASLPYYSQLLVDEYEDDRLSSEYSEESLLDRALQNLVQREYDKGLFDRGVLPADEIEDFLLAVAGAAAREGATGVPISTVRELAEIAATSDLPESEIRRTVQNLTQIAVFAPHGPGRLGFEQEVMEEFLLGRWIREMLSSQPAAMVPVLQARRLPADSIAVSVVADAIKRDKKLLVLKDLLNRSVGRPILYRNLVQLLASRPGADERSVKSTSARGRDPARATHRCTVRRLTPKRLPAARSELPARTASTMPRRRASACPRPRPF